MALSPAEVPISQRLENQYNQSTCTSEEKQALQTTRILISFTTPLEQSLEESNSIAETAYTLNNYLEAHKPSHALITQALMQHQFFWPLKILCYMKNKGCFNEARTREVETIRKAALQLLRVLQENTNPAKALIDKIQGLFNWRAKNKHIKSGQLITLYGLTLSDYSQYAKNPFVLRILNHLKEKNCDPKPASPTEIDLFRIKLAESLISILSTPPHTVAIKRDQLTAWIHLNPTGGTIKSMAQSALTYFSSEEDNELDCLFRLLSMLKESTQMPLTEEEKQALEAAILLCGSALSADACEIDIPGLAGDEHLEICIFNFLKAVASQRPTFISEILYETVSRLGMTDRTETALYQIIALKATREKQPKFMQSTKRASMIDLLTHLAKYKDTVDPDELREKILSVQTCLDDGKLNLGNTVRQLAQHAIEEYQNTLAGVTRNTAAAEETEYHTSSMTP